jgi:hypothetical protein
LLPTGPAPSVDEVKAYMVERYLPGITAGELDEANTRLTAAVTALAAQGVEVRYLSSTFIPAEESCFYWFEGDGADDVRRACEEARVPFARIVETRDIAPDTKEKK